MVSRSLLLSIESIMPSNHLILCRPLLLPPSILPSIRVFSNELALHMRWPKYWSFSISSSSEHSCLISYRMDWLDLLAVQGTLKNLIQHHSSKTSNLPSFVVQAQPSAQLRGLPCLCSALNTRADHHHHIPPLRARENG